MKVTTIILMAATLAAAMPQSTSPIKPYDGTSRTDDARKQNAENADKACKVHQDTNLNDNSACSAMCKGQVDENGYTSATCTTGINNLPWMTDDDGSKYKWGQCECNIKALNEGMKFVIDSLPAIGEIGCQVLLNAFDLVAQVGAAALPGGAAAKGAEKGTSALVKAGNTLKEAGETGAGLLSWLQPCGQSQYTQMVDQVFGTLTGNMVGGGGSGDLSKDTALTSTSSNVVAAAAAATAGPSRAAPSAAALSAPTGTGAAPSAATGSGTATRAASGTATGTASGPATGTATGSAAATSAQSESSTGAASLPTGPAAAAGRKILKRM